MNNLKLITTHKDYLLLVDKSPKRKVGESIFYAGEVSSWMEIDEKGWNKTLPNPPCIIAHLPLNNAPVLEGVPLLPELPKQEEHIEEIHQELVNGIVDEVSDWNKDRYSDSQRKQSWKDLFNRTRPIFNKAASQRRWTDEDIIDAWELGAKEGSPLTRKKKDDLFKSLSPIKLPIGFEPEMEEGEWLTFSTTYDQPDREEYRKFDSPRLKIINNVIQGRYIYD